MQPEELKKQVDEAISNILVGGQEYRIGTRHLTRADLGQLRSMQAELSAQIANKDNNGLLSDTYVAFFEGR